MDEKIYFDKNDISVTSTRFIVEGNTYAMSGVTSVKSFVKKPSIVRMILSILLIVLGALSAIGTLVAGSIEGMIVPLIMLAIGVALWFVNKKKFIVLLNTSSGESQALKSNDSALVDSVIDALNEAIVGRG